MSERTASDIAADLWRLRDEADTLAHHVAGQAVAALPDGVREALQEATAGLYFGEEHKHPAKPRAIIRALSPDLYRVLDERGERAAYDVARGEPT